MTKVLLTGAAGNLGRVLSAGLADDYTLRLTDIVTAHEIPDGAIFRPADLADKDTVLALCEGVDAIVHFGAISKEASFEDILEANLRGTYHIFEGARRNNARVIFASSNHAIGYHERGDAVSEDCHLRPDSYYGLSKAYGELLGRTYWAKHGVENACLRIGSCFAEPADRRQLHTWMSFADLTALVRCCLTADTLGHAVYWGVSDNTGRWWSDMAGEQIGFRPKDSADAYASTVEGSAADIDPVAARYQGGAFCSEGYSRSEPAPRQLFRGRN
jgi:uronate dehydrogenase